jgi:type I restriction enzyme S subunit
MQSNVPMVNLGELLTERQEKPDLESVMIGELPIIAKIGFNTGAIEYRDGYDTKTNMILVRPGDLVISGINAEKGAIALYDENNSKNCAATIHYSSYSIDKKKADPKFLWLFFRSEMFKSILIHSLPNGIKTEVKPFRLLKLEISLPPLKDQQRIVAMLERLMAKIEEAQRQRGKAIADSEKVVRAYSNHFFDPNSHYPKFSLGEVAEIRSGVTLGRELRGKTIHLPYLRVANVQDGHLNLQKMKEVEILESEKEKWKLLPGDILLTEGGDWDKLGRGTVWHDEIPDCIHQNHIFRLRFNLAEFLPEYVSLFIGSDYSKSYFQSASKQTTNLASINQKQLKNLKIPKPSLPEQRRIVAHLDRLQAKVDEVKRLQAETEREMEVLVPAVLAKAFYILQ